MSGFDSDPDGPMSIFGWAVARVYLRHFVRLFVTAGEAHRVREEMGADLKVRHGVWRIGTDRFEWFERTITTDRAPNSGVPPMRLASNYGAARRGSKGADDRGDQADLNRTER